MSSQGSAWASGQVSAAGHELSAIDTQTAAFDKQRSEVAGATEKAQTSLQRLRVQFEQASMQACDHVRGTSQACSSCSLTPLGPMREHPGSFNLQVAHSSRSSHGQHNTVPATN